MKTKNPFDRLTPEEQARLRQYAAAEGRTWKNRLAMAWLFGSDELRETRNTVGPTDLRKIKL